MWSDHIDKIAEFSGGDLQLNLTHSLTHALCTAAAATEEFALLLLIALLEIVLLALLPQK